MRSPGKSARQVARRQAAPDGGMVKDRLIVAIAVDDLEAEAPREQVVGSRRREIVQVELGKEQNDHDAIVAARRFGRDGELDLERISAADDPRFRPTLAEDADGGDAEP